MNNKSTKKLIFEEVKKFIEGLGYKLMSKEYLNNKQKLATYDKFGYYYSFRLNDIKNGHLPRKFSKSNSYTIQNIKLWCKINNKHFDLISNTYNGSNCPFCSGSQVGLSNCLATKNPDLAKEWHPTKNGDFTPYDVTCGSNKYAWWQCKDDSKHEWYAQINSRNNHNCPFCDGQLATEENNLLVCNPELASEWNYKINDKSPSEYTPKSSKKVWWRCGECNHEWESIICSRNRKNKEISGCPECSKSKGEKECKRIFDLKNIYYIPQKEFDNLVGLGGGNLSYDFYLSQYNLLIEYQGEFHDHAILNYKNEPLELAEARLLKQKEHDRRKRQYCLDNNIEFLEIWYWDYDNIEIILDKYLNQLEVKIS